MLAAGQVEPPGRGLSRSAQTRDSEVTLFTLSTVAFGVSYAGHLHCFSILMK